MSKLIDLRDSYQPRMVWEILMQYQQQFRQSSDYGNDHVSYETRERVVHIVAHSMEMAKAAFDFHYPARCDYKFVHINPVCSINHEVVT